MQASRLLTTRRSLWLWMHLVFVISCRDFVIELSGDAITISPSQKLMRTVSFTTIFLLHCCPRLLNATTAKLLPCAVAVLASLTVAPGLFTDASLHVAYSSSSIVVSINGLLLLHTPTYAVLAAIYLISACSGYLALPSHNEQAQLVLMTSIALVVAMGFCSAAAERLLEGLHRATVDAMYLEQKQLASERLLNIFYDVVLEVGPDLAISSSSLPQLAGFLPCRAGERGIPLQGVGLQELIPCEDDRQAFTERMCQPLVGEDSSVVETMHLSLGHSMSESLRAEVFSFRFRGQLGQSRHLLGIRQFGEEERTAGLERSMTVTINLFHANLPIVEISEALQRELGPASLGFCEFLDSKGTFSDQLQDAVNSWVNSEACNNRFKVQLRPRLNTGTRIQADCSVDRVGEGAESNFMPVTLSFTNLRRHRRYRRGSNSSGHGLRGTPAGLPDPLVMSSHHPTSLGKPLSL